ncbi:MAG: helix-turn-helix transcriptional regulator [Kordiimonadaceae bacterium]|nr:helix-turn-helix transcriptional regulator [Kordiimonadaceae bacterium]
MITPEQIRAAKGLLNWSNTDLATATGLHKNTLSKAENGSAKPATMALVKVTLEDQGVVFQASGEMVQGGPGVRLSE